MIVNDSINLYENSVVYENCEWFFDIKKSVLFKHEIGSCENKAMLYLPKGISVFNYGKIVLHDHYIFIIPAEKLPIPQYDVISDEVNFISYEGKASAGRVFWDAVSSGNAVYFIPSGFDSIVKYDVETKEVKNILLGDNSKYHAWGSICVKNDYLFFTQISDSTLIKLSLLDDKVSKIINPNLPCGGGIVSLGKNFLFIPYDANCVLICDEEGVIVKRISQFPNGYESGTQGSFSYIIDCRDEVYMLPRTANMGIVFNKTSQMIRKIGITLRTERIDYFDKYMPYLMIKESGTECFFLRSADGLFVNENGKELNVECTQNDMSVITDDFYSNIILEDNNGMEKLDSFIEAIATR